MGSVGTVYLIGAGPGDPGLVTVRGAECLRLADTVVYDHLANPVLLEHAVKADERIYVGKSAGDHSMAQEEINALLVAKARQGRVTARLKGGDPFVFGRGGEEVLALAEAGVPFEVVPGVTAAVAAAAYAGIPVTHRTCNSVLTLVTGHEDPSKPSSAIDWQALATGGGTLAFYMGVRNLPGIVERLVAHGRPPATPAAVIGSGTLPGQQVAAGTLADIVDRAAAAGVRPPAVILVGEVVALRERLRWFDTRPLCGLTVVVTRARDQASELARALERQGAAVLQLPTIRIAPPSDWGPVRAAATDVGAYDWVLFTSVNGVENFFRAVADTGGDSRRFGHCRVAAIGDATAEALRARGVVPDLVPPRFTSEALFAALRERDWIAGRRFLLPQTDIAPEGLAEQLQNAGGVVTAVTAYRTLPAEPDAAALAALRDGHVAAVTFTSASTARNFAALMRAHGGGLPTGVAYVSIGPETTKAAVAEGLQIGIEAASHTIPGLVQAMVERLGGKRA